MDIDDIVAQLDDDGATYKFDDGRALRVRIEPDDLSVLPLQDHGDVWGKTSRYSYDYIRNGHEPRPADFTGNAEKLQVGRGDWVWWEPYDMQRDNPDFPKYREQVRTLIECGFSVVIVELLDGEDAYHRPIVTQVATLGGIDSLENDYLAHVVRELLDELELEVPQ